MFNQSAVASTIFFAVARWGAGTKAKKKLRKVESVVGMKLTTLEEISDRMLVSLLAITDNDSHPLHNTLDNLKSSFNNRFLQPRCLRERYSSSFLPTAISLFNSST